MIIKVVSFLAGILLLAFGLASCDDSTGSCKEQSANHLSIGFYTAYKSGSRWVAKDSSLATIVVKGVGKDSVLYNTKTIKAINLPLSQLSDTTKFVVTINSTLTDTFCAVYKRSLVFISYKCGYRTNFNIEKLDIKPQSPFDSIVITHPNVSDVTYENCKIYLKPAIGGTL
jgi:hypothetical protein